MKKYLFTVLTLAVFAVCFVASDDSDSSNSSVENSQSKEEEICKKAYEKGKDNAIKSSMYQDEKERDNGYRIWYTVAIGTPSTDEEIAIYKKGRKEYERGYDDGRKFKYKMEN